MSPEIVPVNWLRYSSATLGAVVSMMMALVPPSDALAVIAVAVLTVCETLIGHGLPLPAVM